MDTGDDSGSAGVFAWFQEQADADSELRENIRSTVRELEQASRALETKLAQVHQIKAVEQGGVLAEARAMFPVIEGHYARLRELTPADCFYRYHAHWRNVTQQICYLSSLLVYLESGKLITLDQLQDCLKVSADQKAPFHIDLEDFLMGLTTLSQELTRLAVNSVTNGDFDRPKAISLFLSDLHGGFRQLNLKNDGLRKRVDSLKYDAKKIESVVYDLSIRGLLKDA